MSKDVKILLFLAVLTAFSTTVSAQVTHYLGAWAHGGEYSYIPTYDETQGFELKTSLGGGGGLGFVYELRAGRHFLLDVGLGANSAWTRFRVPDGQYPLHNMIDSEGEVFDYVYEVEHRKDAYWNTSLQVPLLIGGQWGKFYFLAGAKFDMAIMTNAITKASVTTGGDYSATYIMNPEILHNIPSQGFVNDMPYVDMNPVSFKPNVTASAEIGMRLGDVFNATGFDVPKQKVQYRIALFADFGVLDFHRAAPSVTEGQSYELMHVPATYKAEMPLMGVKATDIMSSKEMADLGGTFRSFMAGVKFTVLFRVPEKKACVICKDQPFRSTHGLLE